MALGSQSEQEACLTSDSKAAIFRKEGWSGRSGGSHEEQGDNYHTAGLGEIQLPLEKRQEQCPQIRPGFPLQHEGEGWGVLF